MEEVVEVEGSVEVVMAVWGRMRRGAGVLVLFRTDTQWAAVEEEKEEGVEEEEEVEEEVEVEEGVKEEDEGVTVSFFISVVFISLSFSFFAERDTEE